MKTPEAAPLEEPPTRAHDARPFCEALLAVIREPLIVVDHAGRVRGANAAFARAFAPGPDEPSGKALAGLAGTLWRSPRLRALLEDAARGEISRDVQLEGSCGPDGRRRVLLANARGVGAGADGRVLLALEDVTDRSGEALRGRRAQEQEVLARISHELRTPVTAIKGFAETLRRGGLRDRRHRLRFVETIERHSDWLSRIIEELLTLYALESKAPRYEPQAIELSRFLKRFSAGLAPVARKRGVRLRAAAEPSLSAWADRDQLERALQSLCENALAHARLGVEMSAYSEGRSAVVEVRDDGPGVPAELLPRVFEGVRGPAPRRGRSGTGLGLRIARCAVETNRGRIWAENARSGGAVFRFTLPTSPAEAPAPTRPPAA